MPALLHQKKKTPLPPCGRRRSFIQPRSPFQKLIEHARLRTGISTRELSRQVSQRPNASVDQSTLWVWLHNTAGYPSPRSFKPAHIKALGYVLGIPEPQIRTALDESRAIYATSPAPTPQGQLDALRTLEQTLKAVKLVYVRRTWVLNLVHALIAGAEVAPRV